MDLADFEGTLRVVIPDEIYRRHRAEFSDKVPILIEGRLEAGGESAEPLLKAAKIKALSPPK